MNHLYLRIEWPKLCFAQRQHNNEISTESVAWSKRDYNAETNGLENKIPKNIFGPKSMCEEIWIDGIENLHSGDNIENVCQMKNDSEAKNINDSLQPLPHPMENHCDVVAAKTRFISEIRQKNYHHVKGTF